MDNYSQLKKFRKGVFELYEENVQEARAQDELETIEISQARDGNEILLAGRNGKNYRLNSSYRPVEEAKKWGRQYEINDINAVYFMFGLGNGLFVNELMAKMKSDTVLIVYEPSVKLFQMAMEHFDFSELIQNERVILVVRGINDEYLPAVMERCIFWANMNTLKKCIHPQYDQLFPKEMEEYDRIVWDGYLKARSNVNTAAKFQTVFAPNTLYGMSLMKGNNLLLDLYDRIDKDVPAIIVAAGPSLEKNIDDLKLAKGKAYIIAVDKTIPILLRHDIIPDFTISIDAKKWPGYYRFPEIQSVPMFCLYEANRKIMERHTGRKIFFDSSEYPKAILMMLNKATTAFSAGGSVATAAFTVCVALDLKNIVLIGQDLAYLDGKTHSGKISSGEKANGGEGNHRIVEGIDGKDVVTRADWYRYLDWFNNAVKACPQCHVIDATEGGAKIQGTEILTLKETIDKYCTKEVDVEKMMEELPPALNDVEYQILIEYIEQSSKDLVIMKGKLRQAMDDCKKLIRACQNGTINEPKYTKPIKNLSKTNQYAEGKPVYRLLDSLVVTEAVVALKDIYVQSSDANENLRRTFEQSRDFYQALLDAEEKLRPILDETIQRMKEA